MDNNSIHTTVPRLRFPDFLNDGEWEVKSLGDIAKFYKGKGIPKSEASDKGKTPCVRYGELYTYYKEVIDATQSFTNIPIIELFLSKANDVIIPSSGETKEDISTASCVIKDNIALGGDINVIRTPHNGIFLSYYLNNAKKDEIAKIAQGVSIIHLYNDQLKNLKITLPSIEEQKKIADCLTALDELIASTNGKLEQLKSYKKGLMQKLFPAKGKKLPELRFKEFEKDGEWEEKKLGEIVEILDYKRQPVSKINRQKGRYPYYGANGIQDYVSDYIFDGAFVLMGEDGSVINKDNTPVLNWATGKIWVNNHAHVLGENKSCAMLKFVYYSLSMVDVQSIVIGMPPKINQQNMCSISISVPSLSEQRKIAGCLTSIDEMINQYTNKVALLELYKKGLMQQMFPTSK